MPKIQLAPENRAELESFKTRFDPAHARVTTACCELEKGEGKIERLQKQCAGGRDGVDPEKGGEVLKLMTAEKQLSLASEQLAKEEGKIAAPMQELRNVLNDFQDVYSRAAKPWLEAVEEEAITALTPFSANEASAKIAARGTDLVRSCGRFINRNFNSASDPRAEAKEAARRIDSLLANEDPFAAIRAAHGGNKVASK